MKHWKKYETFLIAGFLRLVITAYDDSGLNIFKKIAEIWWRKKNKK